MMRAALLLIAMMSAHATASPMDLFGFGGRSPGLAGTGVATANDYESVFLNPSGIADVRKKRLTLGILYGDFALEMDGQATATEAASGYLVGGALPIPLGGVLRERVGLGFGFYVPVVALNRARVPAPGDAFFALLESRSHVVALQTALGFKLTPRWSAGAGVIVLAALRGSIHVDTDPAGRFTTRSEQRLVTHITPVLGARFLARPRLELGWVFRGEMKSNFDIQVTNDLLDVLPLTIPPIQITGTAQYVPLTVAAEASWQANASTRLAAQLAYQRWSAYPPPTFNPLEDGVTLSPGFHDTVVPRIAAEWSVIDNVQVRGGYWFAASPAPEMTGHLALLDNHRHVLSFGIGISPSVWDSTMHVDFWGQTHLLVPRRHTRDLDNFEEGELIPFYSKHTSGHVLVGGLSLGLELQ